VAENTNSNIVPGKEKNGNGGTGVLPYKRWFYVLQTQSGAITKGETDSPAGLVEQLNEATIAWVDYIVNDFDTEAVSGANQVGFSNDLVSVFVGDSRETYEDMDTEMGLKVPTIQVRNLEVIAYPLLLLLKKNLIMTIHPLSVDRRFQRLRRYSETFMRKIPTELGQLDRMTLLFMRIIDHNNDRNFEHLRQIEDRGGQLHEMMADSDTPRSKLGPQIYQMKHALITYLDGLWNTVDVLHAVRYGDAELITDDPKLLERLGILVEDVNRQIGLAEHMSEVLASGLEVLQSIYNNQLQELNNRLALLMTYLTILGTAVLVPNTIATMMGNAVFNIGPQDMWWYLILMIGSTVLATWLVYWWIRRRGLLPKKTK
jgi:magnesium transporter